jgi:hypothetical protein
MLILQAFPGKCLLAFHCDAMPVPALRRFMESACFPDPQPTSRNPLRTVH